MQAGGVADLPVTNRFQANWTTLPTWRNERRGEAFVSTGDTQRDHTGLAVLSGDIEGNSVVAGEGTSIKKRGLLQFAVIIGIVVIWQNWV